MDMTKNPAAHAAAHTKPKSLPGEPHNRDMSNPGEIWGFVLAVVLIAVLGAGFLLNGLAGVGIVMVAIVPVVYIVLITISVGR
ncbi:MAG: hypothetical protein AUK37_05295 [Rhodobacterales bacterium CG2_30_65_12]|nr:MAG: hypothetical protein AUK37_05295 [Rhodobacterales bacterium CG2_30_65_12]